ncbi:MAG TPA: nodulation protein NfeD [Acidobacteriota bacterium]|nr:nodulation protein NfeD [Acidobacteriota bacterium]
MKRIARLALVLAVGMWLAVPLTAGIVKVRVDGVIDPITAEFIRGAVETAESEQAEFLLIELSTPGGLGVSMQEIVQEILTSEVPVVCYVTPQGTHAASAGFFILLAADVAVMAPGTNTGAATPIFPFGIDNEVLLKKVKNDALASLRSIVERRSRNYELAAKAVEEAASFTEQEALDGNLIDLIAEDQDDLLNQLEGREVSRFNGQVERLRAQGQSITQVQKSYRQQLLSTVANPNVALVLVVIGILGLYFEITSPGLIFPGVLGAISLLLGLMGFSFLPVNIIGVALILLAIGLLVAEVKVQGFGVLGIGGAISMFLGLLLLIDSPFPALRIDMGLAAGVVIGFSLIFIFLVRLAFKAFREPSAMGDESLAGMAGEARSEITARGGKVFVNGEWWDAVSTEPIPKGSRVRVVGSERQKLVVEYEGEA